MKKCKLSPDAYIQMALQLAHYRVKIINQINNMVPTSSYRIQVILI